MYNRYITFISLVFLAIAAPSALADQPQISAPATRAEAAPPVFMSDEALASYITGRLQQALKDDDYKVEQTCNETGCSIVVH